VEQRITAAGVMTQSMMGFYPRRLFPQYFGRVWRRRVRMAR
jgi:hypothetical protein